MASVTIRPSGTSYTSASMYGASTAHACVNESVSDGDTTYCYITAEGNNTTQYGGSAVFTFNNVLPNGAHITNITLYAIARETAGVGYVMLSAGSSTSGNISLNTSYTTYSYSFSNYNGYTDTSELSLTLTVRIAKANSKDSTCYSRCTQFYAIVDYEYYTYSCAAVAGTGISSASVSEATVTYNNSCTFTAQLQEGYAFKGWYSDEACTTLVSTANPYIHTITDNITLYAKGVQKPVLSVSSQDVFIISADDAHDTCTVTFTASLPLSYWEARAYLSGTADYGHGKGVLVESGNSLQENITGIVEVINTELSSGSGDYTIYIYGCSEDGAWSDA